MGDPARTSGSGVAVPRADALLEMTGLSAAMGAACAVLTPTVRARMRELRPGQVLEVRVDDPTARGEVESWCQLAGHELLAVNEAPPGVLRCYLRKRGERS